MDRRFVWLATLAWTSACTAFAPPPLLMHQSETIFRSEPGTVDVGGYVGGGVAGVPFGDGYLGALGVADIVAPVGWKFGISGAAGASNGTARAGRVFAEFRPPHQDWVGIHVGGSGGAFSRGERAMDFAGADVGVSAGHTFGTVRPYVTAGGAFTQPFHAGAPSGPVPDPTVVDAWTARVFYALTAFGVCAATPSGFELAAELNVGYGWQPGGTGNTMFSLSGGLRYRFGTPAKESPLPAPAPPHPTTTQPYFSPTPAAEITNCTRRFSCLFALVSLGFIG